MVGLEQIFQDMEIIEEPTFLNIQERRAVSDESFEIANQGNKKSLLYSKIVIINMNSR